MNRVIAFHHPLTGPLATHVDVAIIRVSQVAVSASLCLSVEFVEHEVEITGSGKVDLPGEVPSALGLTSPFSQHPAFKNARMNQASTASCLRLV